MRGKANVIGVVCCFLIAREKMAAPSVSDLLNLFHQFANRTKHLCSSLLVFIWNIIVYIIYIICEPPPPFHRTYTVKTDTKLQHLPFPQKYDWLRKEGWRIPKQPNFYNRKDPSNPITKTFFFPSSFWDLEGGRLDTWQ